MAVNSTTLLVENGREAWANVSENLDDWIERGQYLIPAKTNDPRNHTNHHENFFSDVSCHFVERFFPPHVTKYFITHATADRLLLLKQHPLPRGSFLISAAALHHAAFERTL